MKKSVINSRLYVNFMQKDKLGAEITESALSSLSESCSFKCSLQGVTSGRRGVAAHKFLRLRHAVTHLSDF